MSFYKVKNTYRNWELYIRKNKLKRNVDFLLSGSPYCPIYHLVGVLCGGSGIFSSILGDADVSGFGVVALISGVAPEKKLINNIHLN